MTLAVEPTPSPVSDVAAKSGAIARVAAFLAGALLLLCGLVVSLGSVLVALIAMAIAGRVHRRRGHPLTRGGHWVTASASMTAVVLVAGAAMMVASPRGTLRSVIQTADSASVSAGKEPPPEWLQRLGPGVRVQPAGSTTWSRVGAILGAVWGIAFLVGLLSAVYGSLGWGAGMLLGLAFQGRWPGDTSRPDELTIGRPL